jgi:ankyrin repeat protein
VLPLSLCPLFQEYGFTALIRASFNGHAKVVELLLAAKADTNLKDNVSPLHPLRETEVERPPLPNAFTRTPSLTKGPHVPSRLWA